MIHVVITLPSGNKNCFGTDVPLAFARAQELFPVLGSIELAAYAVRGNLKFDDRSTACPDPGCNVGNPNQYKRYRVLDPKGVVLMDAHDKAIARRYARSYLNHPATTDRPAIFDAKHGVFIGLVKPRIANPEER